MQINKKKLKKKFSASAPIYDRISGLQSEIGRQLLSFLSARQATRILDIGTGTGSLLWRLTGMFPRAEFHGCDLAYGMIKQACHRAPDRSGLSSLTVKSPVFLQADAENLPYRSATFDLVLSNVTYQWVSDLGEAFQEMSRILKPKGKFCISTFAEGTLAELYSSFQRACQKQKGDPGKNPDRLFLSSQNLKEGLQNQGFSQIVLREWTIPQIYPDVRSLLLELKALGASNGTIINSFGLGGRKILTEMIYYYEKYFQNEQGILSTYRVILAQGEKS